MDISFVKRRAHIGIILVVVGLTGLILSLIVFPANDHSAPASAKSVSTAASSRICPTPLKTVATDICDDGVDTAYIAFRSSHYLEYDPSLQQVITLKKAWQARFPSKRVVAMVRMEASSGGNAILKGLLIHYESK